jgi:uncharacterized membrane protein
MVRSSIAWSALAIELLATVVIVWSVMHATARYLWQLRTARADAYEQYQAYVGKGLLLGLEFRVAADILRTAALDEPTFEDMGTLVLLVLVRPFLSWSVVETEGRWAWQARLE